jgi:hypothetical protein
MPSVIVLDNLLIRYVKKVVRWGESVDEKIPVPPPTQSKV